MYKLITKIKRRLWSEIVSKVRKASFYPKIYPSYWHYHFSSEKDIAENINYYSARPNPGAGIGHQMANWIAGYWFAKQFNLQFAHIPFSTAKWEHFLGFGENETTVASLVANGYSKVRLPLFDEKNQNEVALQQQIIASYTNEKIVFVAEQDQYYKDQFGVMEAIKQKFHQATARKHDKLIFDPAFCNIAIHVRRGDIVIGQENQNPNLLMRFQGNDYFEKVLRTVVETVPTEKPIAIYLFSQGEVKDFPEFETFSNLHFCLDMNAQNSFLHMVKADVLISSKSSFSYKPALLSNGIKYCPKDFWHGYPDSKDWIMMKNDGELDAMLLDKLTEISKC